MRLSAYGEFSFGDTVRIRSTEFTETLGLAGKTGKFYGFTTPSITGVDVIGNPGNDRAVAVNIEGGIEPLWFADDLIEFVNHTPGSTMSIAGHNFVRDEDGEWNEIP
jgi:hypothetical protein